MATRFGFMPRTGQLDQRQMALQRLASRFSDAAFSQQPIETATEGWGRVAQALAGGGLTALGIHKGQEREAAIGKTIAEALAAGQGSSATPGYQATGRESPNAAGASIALDPAKAAVPGDVNQMLAILAKNPDTARLALLTQLDKTMRGAREGRKAPATRRIIRGGEYVRQDWDPDKREWMDVSKGPRKLPGTGASPYRDTLLLRVPDGKGGYMLKRVRKGQEDKYPGAILPTQRLPGQSAPTTRTFYNKKGEQVVKQWNSKKGTWERVGGSKAAVTKPQQARNIETATARNRLQKFYQRIPVGMTPREYFNSLTTKQTETGRENPNYDPSIPKSLTRAGRRKIGGDEKYEAYQRWLDTPKAAPPPVTGSIGAGASAAGTEASARKADTTAGSPDPLPRTLDGKVDVKRLRIGHIYVNQNGVRARWNGKDFDPVP